MLSSTGEAMNLELGLQRLWAVASLCWIATVLYYVGADLPALAYQDPLGAAGIVVKLVVAPIAIAHLAGRALLWIVDGFRAPRADSR
jgi:hypothetical protein